MQSLISALILILGCSAFGAEIPEPTLLQGDGVTTTTLEESLRDAKPGSVIVIGEQHYTPAHQNYQLRILNQLRKQGLSVSVGMEFLEYPHQATLENYLKGSLSERDFLGLVGWQGDFGFYRSQVRFPIGTSSTTVALNLPRKISSQIAKGGLKSLSPEQTAKLPPRLEPGNAGYLRRFKKAVGGHLPTPEAEQNYFMAQSAWDDTMAWQASEFLQANPEQVLVIIVGEFHVQYGGGLPDRLKVWGVPEQNIKTISLVNLAGLTPEEKEAQVLPSTEDGPRADTLWISEF